MEQFSKCPAAPKVSVIVPAYNAERFIEQAITSVVAQSFPDWELLVIDDCSSDGTCAAVEALAARDGRIRLLRNETNQGVARTRNRGLELCRGEYIALLDSDDVWHPHKLRHQLERLEQTGAGLCCTSYRIVDVRGEKAREDYLVPETLSFDGLLKENVIGCSTVLLRGSMMKNYRFTTEYYHEDYVLWLELLRDGHAAVGCPQVLADWRFLEDSRSFDKSKAAKNRWRIYRGYLKLPLLKSLWAFACYGVGGIRKYLR